MKLPVDQLVGLIVPVSFAAGLNVYATMLTLGLLGRFGFISIPGQLQILQNWAIIGASASLFAIEFFADKVPAFDLIWNALHTFIRVPIAALLAYAASSQLSPGKQLLATILGGLIALAAHGGKTAARAAVTPSPEPISNFSLSIGEDALAIALTWFATNHPYIAATIVTLLLTAIAFGIRFVVRAMKALIRSAETKLSR